MFISAWYCIG